MSLSQATIRPHEAGFSLFEEASKDWGEGGEECKQYAEHSVPFQATVSVHIKTKPRD